MTYPCVLNFFKNNYKYIIKFVIVGALTFILNITLVWFFYSLFSIQYQLSISYAYALTTCAHFFLNRVFTFRSREQSIAHHGLKYFVMIIVNYLITFGVTTLMVDVFQTSPYVGIVFSTACIAFSSFGLMRFFVFPHSKVNL